MIKLADISNEDISPTTINFGLFNKVTMFLQYISEPGRYFECLHKVADIDIFHPVFSEKRITAVNYLGVGYPS